MAEETRKKPDFKRNDWHKKIKLGRGVKKNQKWRAGKGIHSKVRLNRKGHPSRPRIGWGAANENKNMIQGREYTQIANLQALEQMPKGSAILIANVGKKKREEILNKAKEMDMTILNRYKENKHATS